MVILSFFVLLSRGSSGVGVRSDRHVFFWQLEFLLVDLPDILHSFFIEGSEVIELLLVDLAELIYPLAEERLVHLSGEVVGGLDH